MMMYQTLRQCGVVGCAQRETSLAESQQEIHCGGVGGEKGRTQAEGKRWFVPSSLAAINFIDLNNGSTDKNCL